MYFPALELALSHWGLGQRTHKSAFLFQLRRPIGKLQGNMTQKKHYTSYVKVKKPFIPTTGPLFPFLSGN